MNAKSSDGQTASCSFPVTVTSTVARLIVSCPSNTTVASSNGSSVAVTYVAHDVGRRRAGDGIRDPRVGQHVRRRVDNRTGEREFQRRADRELQLYRDGYGTNIIG